MRPVDEEVADVGAVVDEAVGFEMAVDATLVSSLVAELETTKGVLLAKEGPLVDDAEGIAVDEAADFRAEGSLQRSSLQLYPCGQHTSPQVGRVALRFMV